MEIKIGQRYRYKYTPDDLVLEIVENMESNRLKVKLCQMIKGRLDSIGKIYVNWTMSVGKWEYLEGQNSP